MIDRVAVVRVSWIKGRSFGVVRPRGFEPLTYGLEGRCSIQLSYERIMIMMARSKGVEPLTPRSEVWCSIQLSYERKIWGG